MNYVILFVFGSVEHIGTDWPLKPGTPCIRKSLTICKVTIDISKRYIRETFFRHITTNKISLLENNDFCAYIDRNEIILISIFLTCIRAF